MFWVGEVGGLEGDGFFKEGSVEVLHGSVYGWGEE